MIPVSEAFLFFWPIQCGGFWSVRFIFILSIHLSSKTATYLFIVFLIRPKTRLDFRILSLSLVWIALNIFLSIWYLVNSPMFFNSFAIVYILLLFFCLPRIIFSSSIFFSYSLHSIFGLAKSLSRSLKSFSFFFLLCFIFRGFGSTLNWNWLRERNMHVYFPFDKVYSFAFGKFLLVWFLE